MGLGSDVLAGGNQMIFGRKKEPRRPRLWEDWFAWFPVSLVDGRTAWLEVVEIRDTMDQRGNLIEFHCRAREGKPGDGQFL